MQLYRYLYRRHSYPTKKCGIEEEIYEKVDVMPEFPGGLKELLKFLSKTIYVNHIFNCESGKATVSFVVEKDGSISDPTVVRSIDPKLDSEAIRIVELMPKWKPGKHQGKTVRVKYVAPVTFTVVPQ